MSAIQSATVPVGTTSCRFVPTDRTNPCCPSYEQYLAVWHLTIYSHGNKRLHYAVTRHGSRYDRIQLALY